MAWASSSTCIAADHSHGHHPHARNATGHSHVPHSVSQRLPSGESSHGMLDPSIRFRTCVASAPLRIKSHSYRTPDVGMRIVVSYLELVFEATFPNQRIMTFHCSTHFATDVRFAYTCYTVSNLKFLFYITLANQQIIDFHCSVIA